MASRVRVVSCPPAMVSRPVVWLTTCALLMSMLAPGVRAACDASDTCPAHASNDLASCYTRGSPHVTPFAPTNSITGELRADMFTFMASGLYQLLKVSKNIPNCCYDLEIQALLAPITRQDAPVRALSLPNLPICRTHSTLVRARCAGGELSYDQGSHHYSGGRGGHH